MQSKDQYISKEYHSSKEALIKGLIQTLIICSVLFILIVGFIVGSFSHNILFYILLFSAVFIVAAFTLPVISGYHTMISDEELVIKSIKGINKTVFKWSNVSAVSLGKVYNKYSRYNNSYYGVEIQANSEFKNLTTTYKLTHLENYEELMDQILYICKMKDIKCIDSRGLFEGEIEPK